MKHTPLLIRTTLLALFLVMGATMLGESAKPDTPRYALVWADEFDQKNGSQPDPAKWGVPTRDGNVRWRRWISNSPKACFVKNGALVCRAIANKSERGDTARNLTGAVCSWPAFSFQYGKVEVRMKTNLRMGNSPAAWMVRDGRDADKRYAEIDIVEIFDNVKRSEHTVHTEQSYRLKKKPNAATFRHQLDPSKWHIYGMEWTPDAITFTVDGHVAGSYQRSTNPNDVKEGQWTFDGKFYLILNQSLWNVTGKVKKTYETRFDWVRVYQKR